VDNPAAWHPDPVGRHEYRWWDGSQWTEHVADGGVAAVDPLDHAAPAQTEADTLAASDAVTPAEAGTSAAQEGPDDAHETAELGGTDLGGTSATDAGDAAAAGSAAGAAAWSQPGGTEPTPTPDPQSYQQPAQPQQPYQQQPQQQPYQQQPQQQPYQQGPTDQAGAWPAAGSQQASSAQPSNGIAVAALVIGIISLLIAWIPFVGLLGGLGGALAIIFGFIGRGKVKKQGAPSKGAATAGIVLGAVSLVLSIIATAAIFVFGQQFFGDTIGSYQQCLEETGGDEDFCERQLEDDLFNRFGVPGD
jgi:hypothetical protein